MNHNGYFAIYPLSEQSYKEIFKERMENE